MCCESVGPVAREGGSVASKLCTCENVDMPSGLSKTPCAWVRAAMVAMDLGLMGE
jgi:hypothetical protein